MTRSLLTFLVVGFSLTMVGQPILAHHSESAEYDQSKPVKVTGTISKVEWQNPHVWFYVDVKDESGKITTWGFSNSPPGSLMRRGITKAALKLGAVVNVEGSRARDGSNNASGRRVTFADGKNVFTSEGGRMKTRWIVSGRSWRRARAQRDGHVTGAGYSPHVGRET